VHDTILAVVSSIRNNQLQDPARLPGYLHTSARRQMAAYIGEAVHNRAESTDLVSAESVHDSGATPEQAAIEGQQREMARRLLASLPAIDRQILLRFYYQGQKPQEICRDLRLTETQFRLRKSRAKKRFEEITRKTLKRGRLLSRFLVRHEVLT
jgi:RNA polymerase sigma factor (sigma-70 family)